MKRSVFGGLLSVFAVLFVTSSVRGQSLDTTEGYPEKVIQWMVEEGETCADIAEALYGDARHAYLLSRYNDVRCDVALPNELILVVPYAVAEVPVARLNASTPTVRARAPKSTWQTARDGMALDDGYAVNTLEDASADILFRDRSRILLQEQTLVIIYGTAASSQATAGEDLSVELNEGELRAGIAALRGRGVEVETTGGGKVIAQSDDTVLRRKQDRTTVSVFDGQATVENAGQVVKVQTNFGSAFQVSKPPSKPRPLPPAPVWQGEAPTPIRLVRGSGQLELSWSEVPLAVGYRIEVALDADFTRVVVRQEVPSDVRSLRAENLPPDSYFVRVRAVDKDDFLGIASQTSSLTFVGIDVELGRLEGTGAVISPYGAVGLGAMPGVEYSLDGKEYRGLPAAIDLRTRRPDRIWLRRAPDGAAVEIPIEYERPRLELSAVRVGASLEIRLQGEGLAALAERAGFGFSVHQQEQVQRLAPRTRDATTLTARAVVDEDRPTEVRLVDASQATLGDVQLPGLDAAPAAVLVVPALIGPRAAVVSGNRELSFDWWTPQGPSGLVGSVIAATDSEGGQLSAIGRARIADTTLSLRISSNTLGQDIPSDGSLFGHVGHEWALSPAMRGALRAGLVMPAASASPPPRASVGAALGASAGRSLSWLANLDARAGLSGDTDGLSAWQLRAGGGATYEFVELVRASLLLDAYWLESRARGATQANIEFGRDFAASAGVRWSPWGDDNARWMVGGSLLYRGDDWTPETR